MPPAEDIQRYLAGAWRMMTGRPDGIREMDLSADGFWNSFFAIVVALPVLLAGWVPLANEIAAPEASFGGRLSLVTRLALVDLGAWVLPLVVLALVAGFIGIKDRFVHYVVANNWGSALLVWFMLPPSLIRLFWPGNTELVTMLSLVLFLVTMGLSWRLTNAALGKGPAVATGVFGAVFITSLFVLLSLQALLGIALE